MADLTLEQLRKLSQVCWDFEEAWQDGKSPVPEDWASDCVDLPREVVLSELRASQEELELHGNISEAIGPPPKDERYEFISKIAHGGSSEVWLVFDRHLQRETAIKFLLDSRNNAEMQKRLEQEARICGRLIHPNIITIYELASFDDGRPYVCMRLIRGKTFKEILASDQGTSLTKLLDIFAKICEAMAYAHGRQIIHRDLKPANIMVSEFGEVQVMDWGLSKDVGESIEHLIEQTFDISHDETISKQRLLTSFAKLRQSKHTSVSSPCGILGTIAYMAPEQARGELYRVDKRADVFALGGILCQILTGVAPYGDLESSKALTLAQSADLQDTIRRLEKCRKHRLARLAIDCLKPEIDARPKDAADVQKRLATIIQGYERQRRIAATTLGLVLFGSLATVAYAALASPSITRNLPIVTVEEARAMLNNHQDASYLKSYKQVLKAAPNDPDLHYRTAAALYTRGRAREALPIIKRLVEIDPNRYEHLWFFGEILFRTGQFDASLDMFRTCETRFPERAATDQMHARRVNEVIRGITIRDSIENHTLDQYDHNSSQQLREIAEICDRLGNIPMAIQYYSDSIHKESDRFKKSILRFEYMSYFLERVISYESPQRDDLNQLALLASNWLHEQIEYAKESHSSIESRGPTHELARVLADRETNLAFVKLLIADKRVDAKVRAKLTNQWNEIEKNFINSTPVEL